VRDESHLDDMRSAIRGDFERLERRRGVQELMHVEPAAALEPDESEEPAAEPEEPIVEPVATESADHPSDALPVEAVGGAAGEGRDVEGPPSPERRSLLARLFSR
jgi:hypothetical protein